MIKGSLFQKIKHLSPLALMLTTFIALTACQSSSDDAPPESTFSYLNMNLPDAMTGGKGTAGALSASVPAGQNSANAMMAASIGAKSHDPTPAGSGEPCEYRGAENGHEFDNGYQMTRFLVGAAASWTCMADLFVYISTIIPHDDTIQATDNIKGTVDYERDEPTHYRVTDDSATQTTIRLFYDFDSGTPPTLNNQAGYYFSWDDDDAGTIGGKMVLNVDNMTGDAATADRVTDMRMDYAYTPTQKQATLYLKFAGTHPNVDGFRIEVTKDLTAVVTDKVFTAKGLMAMKDQWMPLTFVTATPNFVMYAEANLDGQGAAIAQFQDVGANLVLPNAESLGEYQFTKDDIYYFTSTKGWEYIYKTVTVASLAGGKNNVTTPYTDAEIETFLSLTGGTIGACTAATPANDPACVSLINAVVGDGFAGQEQNQGTDPCIVGDWRCTGIGSEGTGGAPSYLTQIYPDTHTDWVTPTDVFAHTFP